MTKIKLTIMVVLAAVALTACGAGQPTPVPTLDPAQIQQTVGAVQTQAVQAAFMQMTQTAQVMPTATATLILAPSGSYCGLYSPGSDRAHHHEYACDAGVLHCEHHTGEQCRLPQESGH